MSDLKLLKKEAFDAIEDAIIAASKYARQLDIGDERTHWFGVAEKIRAAPRK